MHSKLSQNSIKDASIDNCCNIRDIAEELELYFSRTFDQSGDADPNNHSTANDPVGECGPSQRSDVAETDTITAELVDSSVRYSSSGETSGPDDLSAEHLMYGQSRITILLCRLFRLMLIQLRPLVEALFHYSAG